MLFNRNLSRHPVEAGSDLGQAVNLNLQWFCTGQDSVLEHTDHTDLFQSHSCFSKTNELSKKFKFCFSKTVLKQLVLLWSVTCSCQIHEIIEFWFSHNKNFIIKKSSSQPKHWIFLTLELREKKSKQVAARAWQQPCVCACPSNQTDLPKLCQSAPLEHNHWFCTQSL